MRIGIDVGGTNTDAVLMDGRRGTRIGQDPHDRRRHVGDRHGDRAPARRLRPRAAVRGDDRHHPFHQRDRRAPPARANGGPPARPARDAGGRAVRGLARRPPRSRSAPTRTCSHGGNEFDGRELSPLDEPALVAAVRELVAAGVESVALAAVFSPITPDMERRAGEIVAREAPELAITLSHEIGRLGLLERENAAAINAALRVLSTATVGSFRREPGRARDRRSALPDPERRHADARPTRRSGFRCSRSHPGRRTACAAPPSSPGSITRSCWTSAAPRPTSGRS